MSEALFEIDIVGSEEVQRALEGIDRNLKGGRLLEAWERATEMVAIEVRERAPHWRGILYAGIEEEVIPDEDGFMGVVYNDQFYAPFQERGTEPYFPNVDALEEWSDAHNVSPFLVARAIASRGIKPLKFFEQGLIAAEDLVFDLIGEATGEIIETGY